MPSPLDKFDTMRTRDLQSALRKRGVDHSKLLMREELLAKLKEVSAGEEAAAARKAAAVGQQLRREAWLGRLWFAARWGALALSLALVCTAGRPWLREQQSRLRLWLGAKQRLLATAWRLRSAWGALGILGLAVVEFAMAHTSASILASWVVPRASPLRRFMFPILPLSLNPAMLMGGSDVGGGIGGFGGLNVGGMVQGWLLRKVQVWLEAWTSRRLGEATERRRAAKDARKLEKLLRRGMMPGAMPGGEGSDSSGSFSSSDFLHARRSAGASSSSSSSSSFSSGGGFGGHDDDDDDDGIADFEKID